MDGPCGCRARSVQETVDFIRGLANDRLIFVMSDSVLKDLNEKKLESVNAPEYSLLGGGILKVGLLCLSIKRKAPRSGRARTVFLCFFTGKP